MLNIFPTEIVYSILPWVDLKTYSSIISLNKQHYNTFFSKNDPSLKWDIIDLINKRGSPVPLTLDTYFNYRFAIDWITIIYNKIRIPEHVIELFMKNGSNTKQDQENIKDTFDIKIILGSQKLSHDFLRKYHELCGWENLIVNQNLPEDLLIKIVSENHLSPTQWYNLWITQKYSIHFIDTYFDFAVWHAISSNKDVITTDVLNKYYDHLIWPQLTVHGINQEIIEAFIQKLDMISWTNIACFSKLSCDFIIKYRSHLNLQIIFRSQQVNSDTIIYLINLLDDFDKEESWINIALYQSLDFNFINKFKNELSSKYLIRNPRIKRKDIYNVYSK